MVDLKTALVVGMWACLLGLTIVCAAIGIQELCRKRKGKAKELTSDAIKSPKPCIKCGGWQGGKYSVCHHCKQTMDATSNVTLQLKGFLYLLLSEHLTMKALEHMMAQVREIKKKHYAFGPLKCVNPKDDMLAEKAEALARELLNEPPDSDIGTARQNWYT